MKVLKFGAVWCSGCLVMKPRWQEIEKENPWIKTEYFEYDEAKEAVLQYNIEGENLPVFVFLDKDGSEFLRLNGETSKEQLVRILNENKDR
jgi:thiol-disulfide isomerase/thioredoxin